MALNKFNSSLYKTLLEFNDIKVIDWARNVFSKVKNDGILPKYMDREKQEDIADIDEDKLGYVSNLEVNNNFTFDRCISGQDLLLQKEVNIGVSHVIQFEVSSENFADFRLLVDRVADVNYINVEVDKITYKCSGDELVFTSTSYGNPSKITITRDNFTVRCDVDGVRVDELTLTSNSEFYFTDLLRSSEGVELGDVKYGFLYNQYVIQGAGDLSIIPTDMASVGWKVPALADFFSLIITYLGDNTIEDNTVGGKLKEATLDRWNSPNTGATNEVGFTGVGSGIRTALGVFLGLKTRAGIWATPIPGGIDGLSFFYDVSYAAFGSYGAKAGLAIRLVRPATTSELSLADGTEVDVYIGNDLREYKAVKIDNKVWLAENLAETKYRGGSNIVEVTDTDTWKTLLSGARCSYDNNIENTFVVIPPVPPTPPIPTLTVNYGRLYNWYALNEANFAPTDWKVPDVADLDTLVAYLGGNTVAGGKLKEVGTTHWASPNTSADDSSGLKALPTGYRYSVNGSFLQMPYYGYIASKTVYITDGLNNKFSAIKLEYNSGACSTYALPYFAAGVPVRLLWTGTGTPPATITDYDGYVYDVVQVGTQYWLKQSWACTHLNNGTEIPEITDNSAWAAATSMARCSYNNDSNNV